ncbi:MAG TPA: hypothetical protein VFN09_11135 [Rhodanobacteraceae bacterium]|nr:hypothetical protein [Rhodanobacteraceae bacterium]
MADTVDNGFFQPAWLATWKYADVVNLRDAACVLTDYDPAQYKVDRVLPSQAQTMLNILGDAVRLGRLPFAAAWEWVDGGFGDIHASPLDADQISKHTELSDITTVFVNDLMPWCDAKGIQHPWQSDTIPAGGTLDCYPDELRAAIEAFKAVQGNPALTAKRSPKAAIAEWLHANKPALSANARDRIATVANWQPTGGAPKTPGE